jgi:glucose-1-phosphate thymidylyltransferase
MKGVVIAGGKGSRLWPLTAAGSKQLLPVFDKPLIYYPLSTLMLAGIREIAVVVTAHEKSRFVNLLGNGNQWGINIDFVIQNDPLGIPHAISQAPESFLTENLTVILGDNLLYGMGLGTSLQKFVNLPGAHAFAYQVSNPSEFGVVTLDEFGVPSLIEEKPINPKSNLAIPGLYFFDNTLSIKIKELTPSSRGELEITDLLNLYLEEKKLNINILERGTAWLDTGSAESLLDASEFVRIVERRQGLKIACLEEIALNSGWITKSDLMRTYMNLPAGSYREYLEAL